MIKIHKKDSIIDIIIKINNCKKEEIILDFPFGHPILHNYTSLKILKNKSNNKNLIIITSDKSAKQVGKKIGIKYSKIGDTDLLEYNYTFLEYLRYILKRYLNEFLNIIGDKNHNIIFEYQKKYGKGNSKIGYFILGLIFSIILFIFIFYFAVNKTYIYITPEIAIKTKAENFVFKSEENDTISNNNIVQLKKISKIVYLTKSYGTTGVNLDELQQSKGKVVFFNKLTEEVRLLKNTRLENINGILFTSDSEIIIPKATYSSTGIIIPGKTIINITSSIYDNQGNLSGSKANLVSDIILTLPGLKANSDKIYAKTLGEIKGANNIFKKQLISVDIDNAKKNMELELKQESLNQLKKQIAEGNNNNNVIYSILSVKDILEYSNLDITGTDKLNIGENIDNFELSGTIKITSYIYNTGKVLNSLSNTIKNSTLTEIQKLLFINDNSLRIADVIYIQKKPLEIKATAQVEVFLIYNFLNKKNNYIEKLKLNILGLPKDEALKILLNNPKISDVEIKIRPFFIKSVSKITNNIIIKVVDK